MRSDTREVITEFKGFWELLFPGVMPPEDSQWALWLLRHDAPVVRRSLTELATKYKRMNGAMDRLYMAKFASAVMNRLSSTCVAQSAVG